MDNEIRIKLEELEKKIDALYVSSEKTRKYMLISLIITVVMLVLPLLIGIFVVPALINSYIGTLEGII